MGGYAMQDVAGYLGRSRRRRPWVTFPALNQEDEQVAAEEPPPAVDWADREQEPGLEADNPPTPGPAATPDQRRWALEGLRRKMEEPPVSLPTRRGNWGGYEEGGVVYKPSLGSKVMGGIGQFLAAAGGGMGAGARAHEEYFGGPYREALGRAGVTQAMREKQIADLTKAAEEEVKAQREAREAELGRKRGAMYEAHTDLYKRRATEPAKAVSDRKVDEYTGADNKRHVVFQRSDNSTYELVYGELPKKEPTLHPSTTAGGGLTWTKPGENLPPGTLHRPGALTDAERDRQKRQGEIDQRKKATEELANQLVFKGRQAKLAGKSPHDAIYAEAEEFSKSARPEVLTQTDVQEAMRLAGQKFPQRVVAPTVLEQAQTNEMTKRFIPPIK